MSDLIEKFKSLDINGASVFSLVIRPNCKIVIELSKILKDSKEVNVCELQFNQVLYSEVKVKGAPWFKEIIGLYAYKDSSYLIEHVKRERENLSTSDIFYHFSIHFEDGSLDIVAKDFIMCAIKKISRANQSINKPTR